LEFEKYITEKSEAETQQRFLPSIDRDITGATINNKLKAGQELGDTN